MRLANGKWTPRVIPALLTLAVAVSLFGLSGCGDDSGAYKADYMGTSEYDRVMREAMRTGDTRLMAEEYLPGND